MNTDNKEVKKLPVGRHRTVTPPPEEMIKLGEEMIEWIKENKPIHLSVWWRFEKHFTAKVWDTMCRAPEFFTYYEDALQLVGLGYLQKGNDIEPSIKQRWQRVYFKDLKEEEDDTAKLCADLKKDADKSVSLDVVEKHNLVMNKLDELQKRL